MVTAASASRIPAAASSITRQGCHNVSTAVPFARTRRAAVTSNTVRISQVSMTSRTVSGLTRLPL